jgi:methylenetetrahydrofolate--tRNA-(uracil-5-)-methyltransferase
MNQLSIIGAGLAGSEAAWQAARQGIKVRLFEMRPQVQTGAHLGADFAELVCSNSLGSMLPDRSSGVLKTELKRLGSFVLACAEQTAIPAGTALAVDRERFSRLVTESLEREANVEIVRQEVKQIPDGPTIIASGPLTSPALAAALSAFSGEEHLYFYDAIAPIIQADSIDMGIAFRASRYDSGEQSEGDYINCPFDQPAYENFVAELVAAERIQLREFEADIEHGVRGGADKYFEGCLPVEIIARRGGQALAFGPMRPTGLRDPRTGRWPYAAVQLRQDNLIGSLYNMVGFQTNLKFDEQKRIFRTIPGLEHAEFARFGQMHRNTFITAPRLLQPTLQANARPDLFFAGQITGVEGYLGNIATGLLAGLNAARLLTSRPLLALPATTMLGSLCHYITHADLRDFQPTKANFGLLPPLNMSPRMGRRDRAKHYASRAQQDLQEYLDHLDDNAA